MDFSLTTSAITFPYLQIPSLHGYTFNYDEMKHCYFTECDEGTYGLDCKYQCPKCTGKHEKCHHVTGKCVRGEPFDIIL